ncbi:protein SUPPRESSOR OF MAX2 1A-like [Primulina huaijiensis]|uniref:protein SUPPRESSOR OF MAX2 1A-like n=1 Tax=Primulina huaijiensis TaxID=1492673 RepID=UPI003CC72862
MRAALSTIQQTLTSDAANVLNLSIAEAGRRNHGQTTPLHVAATLLASPTGFLRQACIRSHPNSSHPLQCRALELCFSVALERLPTAQNVSAQATEPPISNALMAALKRAQANQRRGCPEQQQQPLLAVKVELEQLIISILDDPSVSRVMREASFSSPAVKSTIEQSMNSSTTQANHQHQISVGNVNFVANFAGIVPRIPSNPGQLSSPVAHISPVPYRYLNPRLQQGGAGQASTQKGEEVNRVLEIMARTKKKNPVLVGDTEIESLVKELLRKIENQELGNNEILKNVQIISMDKDFLSDKNQIPVKIKELGGLIDSKIGTGGVILDLGNLKWLVEQPANSGLMQQQQMVSEIGRAAIAEMAKLLTRFEGGSKDYRLWLIGTATCETYLRCQVYHSTMESDLDLQAVPIASKSPLPGMFPRLGTERISCNPIESLNPLKATPTRLPASTRSLSENLDTTPRTAFCSQCSENYEKELAKLEAIEKSFSEAKQDTTKPSLPQWLRNVELDSTDAKTTDQPLGKEQGLLSKQKTQELQKKWKDACLNLHPNFHQNKRSEKLAMPTLSMTSFLNPNLLSRPSFQPKLQTMKPIGETFQLNTTPVASQQLAERENSRPGSPVQTDLVLGRKKTECVLEEAPENQAKDFLSCISSETNTKLLDKFADKLDADTYKKLLKGLMERAWWQAEAASSIASAITCCRLGNGKRRGGASRGDIWLLFTGPDRVAKKKMASVLADQICGANPITICLGTRRDDGDLDTNFRGKTAIDRITEAIRRNPISVILLEDIDEADMLVRGSIKRAIERGRLIDSHGREVGLGNSIFVLTGDWSTPDPELLRNGHFVDEKKLASTASGNWQLGLVLRDKSSKRRVNWLDEEHGPISVKSRKEMGSGLSLDLNLAASIDHDDHRTDESHNSSDLTTHQEDDLGLVNRPFSISSVPQELVNNVDDTILFKPVDSAFVTQEIKKTMSVKFAMTVDDKLSLEVEDDVVEKILGGLWHDRTSLEKWVENVLAPSFDQLKARLPFGDRSNLVARLVIESRSIDHGKSKTNGDWLPSSILV